MMARNRYAIDSWRRCSLICEGSDLDKASSRPMTETIFCAHQGRAPPVPPTPPSTYPCGPSLSATRKLAQCGGGPMCLSPGRPDQLVKYFSAGSFALPLSLVVPSRAREAGSRPSSEPSARHWAIRAATILVGSLSNSACRWHHISAFGLSAQVSQNARAMKASHNRPGLPLN
jgi:hypothetical protein